MKVIETLPNLGLLVTRLDLSGGRCTTGFVMLVTSLICLFPATYLGSFVCQRTDCASYVPLKAWRLK